MEKEKLQKRVKELNKAISNGKIKESDFTDLIKEGLDPKTVEVWKDAYEVARLVSKKRNKNIIGYDLVDQILDSEAFGEVYEQKSDNQLDKNNNSLKPEDNSVCENCLRPECLCKSVKMDASDKEITKNQLEEAVETLENYADKVRNSMFLYDRELFGKTQGLRQNLEKLGLLKLKNPVFKRVEDKLDKKELHKLGKELLDKTELLNSIKECDDYLVDEEVELTEDEIEQVENICAKESAKTIECTDCGSPERNMTELKATASAERQREIQRQVKLGETIEFQNHIQFLTDNMRNVNLSYTDFYHESNNKKLSLSLFVEIKRLFDWAMERKPTATIEIKDLALLLQACEDWHRNNRVIKQLEYVNCFTRWSEWLESQRDINAKAIQEMLSENDSLLDELKNKQKIDTEKCNCDESSECSRYPPQTSPVWKVKYELDENGLEKKSFYKNGKLTKVIDAFGGSSDKLKKPVVAQNIEKIVKEQKETSPFLTGNLKEATDYLRTYAKIKDDSEKPLTPFQQSQVDIDNKFGSSKGVVKKINPFKYVEVVEEDNFIATPIDVKETDTPFRRKFFNRVESNVVEKQDRKDIIAKDQEWKNYINSLLEKLKKKYKSQEVDKVEKSIDSVKSLDKPITSKPMFDLSPWQKTKVYFRDLKNKASTLFKSPEITEEEVDRAIQLMEKQIAEIKKSRGISPDLLRQAFDQKFDYLLPRKDRKYYKQSEEELLDRMSSFGIKETKPICSKVILNKEDIELLKKFKTYIEKIDEIPRNEKFGDESIYIAEHNLFEQARTLTRCFERSAYPYLNNCFVKLEDLNKLAKVGNVGDNFGQLLKKAYEDFALEVDLLT